MKSIVWVIPVVIILIVGLFYAIPAIQSQASTGVFLSGRASDPSGNVLGTSYSIRAPAGQSILTGFGGTIGSISIPSAYVKLNFTGQVSSWGFGATELVQFDKGASQSYPISMSGSGNPPKSFNITLPQSSWTAAQLSAKFSGYGQKLMNATIVQPTVTLNFANALKITKPSAFNYFVQFKLDYEASTTTTTSTSSTTSSSSTSTTTTTSTSTTTSTVTVTSCSTCASGGITGSGVGSGTVSVWQSTVYSATNGVSGNTATNGMIVTVASDATNPAQTVVWGYFPGSLAQQTFCMSLITQKSSTTACGVSPTAYTYFTGWAGALFSVGVNSGDLVIVQVAGTSQVFNQGIIIGQPAQGNLPASPYTSQYQSAYAAASAPTVPTVKCVTDTNQPVFSAKFCSLLSVVSVSF